MRRGIVGLLLALVAVTQGCDRGQEVAEVSVGGHRLSVEVAASEGSQRKGLMGRKDVPDGTGMVFVFEHASRVCMWMKDTEAALSVGYFDEAGRLLQVEELQPLSTELRCAKAPAKYALEVRQGWFTQRGVAIGSQMLGRDGGLLPAQ